jgi:hypothetical protein
MRHALGVILLLAVGSAQAAAVIGESNLVGTGDLTVIEYDNGQHFEFLDLDLTTNYTYASALAEYGGYGFYVADENDVSQLFSAFDINYDFTPGSVTSIGGSLLDNRELFIGYLGETAPNASAGAYNESSALSSGPYFCVSTDGCGPVVFTNDSNFIPTSVIGITLVRAAVPIPAAVWLFGSALVGLGWLRRKQTV